MVSSRPLGAATRGDTARLLGLASAIAPQHEVTIVAPDAAEVRDRGLAMGAVAPQRRVPLPSLVPLQVLAASRWAVPVDLVEGADVVHLSTVRSFPLVQPAFHEQCHVDFVDCLSENMRLRARAQPKLRPLWMFEAELLRRYESRVVRAVRTSSAISPPDARAIDATTATVPNGVTVPDHDPGPGPLPLIVFAGNLGYYPNAAAAVELATTVLPLVRRSIPKAGLHLVGARPNRAVRDLAGLQGVEIFSDVPSVSPHLHSAWAVVAPVRAGTGVQTKVLEGMAHGRPVVTTEDCARRVAHAVPGEHLLVAESSADFANGVINLLEDADRSRVIGEAARDLVRRHHGWPAAGDKLIASYGFT